MLLAASGAPGVPGRVATSRPSLPPSSRAFSSASVSSSVSYKDTGHWMEGPPDPASHILRSWVDTGLGSLFARGQLCLFSSQSSDTRNRLPLPPGAPGRVLSLSICTWNVPWGHCLLCTRSSPEVPESGPCMPFLLKKVPNFAVSGKSRAPGNPLFWHPRPPVDGVPCLPKAAHMSGLAQMCPGLRKKQGCLPFICGGGRQAQRGLGR